MKTADDVKVGTVWTGMSGTPMKVLKLDGDRALLGYLPDPADQTWEDRQDIADLFTYGGRSALSRRDLAAIEESHD